MPFGHDFDDIFKLATPKYVYIRHKQLGILKFMFMFMIFCYVLVYTILIKCGHLVPNHAGGYGTVSFQNPVEDCKEDLTCINKFQTIAKLKYCTQGPKPETLLSKGKDKADPEEEGKDKGSLDRKLGGGHSAEIGDFISDQRDCRFIDNDRLTLENVPNQVFIPMRYVSHVQKMDTSCYDPLMPGFKGHNTKKSKMNCKKGWVTQSTHEFFVADIGDFTLRFQHSFMASDIGLSGVSTDFKGLMAACPSNHPADIASECKRVAVPNSAGAIAPEDEAALLKSKDLGITSLTGTDEGLDQIKFTDLLKLTPVAQDLGWTEDVPDRKLPVKFGHPDTSIRESGGHLMLGINYDNTGKFRPGIPGLDMPFFSLGAIKPITYTYRPYFVPTKENKRVEVMQASDSATERTVNIWYGVTIQMSFEGKIVVFSFSQLLHGFTTGLVLLSSATTLVIYLALYVFKHSEKYQLQMFQYTEDMSRYMELPANRNCSSFTGEYLLDAEAGNKTLTMEQITSILVDSEIRLNRLDGRDPKLTFPASLSPEKIAALPAQVKTLVTNHKKRQDAYFDEVKKKNAQE